MKETKQIHRDATVNETRLRIESIPDVIELPTKSGKWVIKIDGNKLKSLDKFLLLSGCRISECITKQMPNETDRVLNTGNNLELKLSKFGDEDVGVFNLVTLKRKDHVIRAIALPINSKYEPWTKDIIDAWDRGNPWDISRQHCWMANRIIFDDLWFSTGGKFKHLANHGLRHIRIKNLIQDYGFSAVEIQRFVGWTARSAGFNQLMDTYFSLIWRDYFPKLLKERV